MSYSALGIVYSIPTTNSSSVIPNMTVNANVPVPQIAHDALTAAWPEASQRIMDLTPTLVYAAYPAIQQVAPGVVDAAWPRVMQRLPEAVDAAKPYVAGMISQMVPQVWESLKPQVKAEISDIIAKEEGKAAAVGGLLAAGALVGGLLLAKKIGWLDGVRFRK